MKDKTITLHSGKLKKGQRIFVKCNLGFGENVTYLGDVFYTIKVEWVLCPKRPHGILTNKTEDAPGRILGL